MIARILEDSRCTGADRFQALITQEQFNAVQERRKEMHPEIKQTNVLTAENGYQYVKSDEPLA